MSSLRLMTHSVQRRVITADMTAERQSKRPFAIHHFVNTPLKCFIGSHFALNRGDSSGAGRRPAGEEEEEHLILHSGNCFCFQTETHYRRKHTDEEQTKPVEVDFTAFGNTTMMISVPIQHSESSELHQIQYKKYTILPKVQWQCPKLQ